MKTKTTAALLTFFFGWLGFHKFYLGQPVAGILYLIFCWTFIPSIIAFFEFFIIAFMSDQDFNAKFNPGLAPAYGMAGESTKDKAVALGELKKLFDTGVLTAEEYEDKRRKLLDAM